MIPEVQPHQMYLKTERLILRPFANEDAPILGRLIGAYEISVTTLNIPHPYPEGAAEEYIQRTREGFERGDAFNFALTLAADGAFIGSMSIHANWKHHRAEVGYWTGVPYWNQGYASEALRRVIQFGFEVLELNRIEARYFRENGASRRVMEKAGMVYEGMMRQHDLKWGEYKDLGICAIVREDWEASQGQ